MSDQSWRNPVPNETKREDPYDIVRRLGARVRELEAADARTRMHLKRLEHAGFDGVSTDGCAWCLGQPDTTSYAETMVENEIHFEGCPVGIALERVLHSVSEPQQAIPGASAAPCALCGKSTMLRIAEGDGFVPLCSIVCHENWRHPTCLHKDKKCSSWKECAERCSKTSAERAQALLDLASDAELSAAGIDPKSARSSEALPPCPLCEGTGRIEPSNGPPNPPSDDGWNDATRANYERAYPRTNDASRMRRNAHHEDCAVATQDVGECVCLELELKDALAELTELRAQLNIAKGLLGVEGFPRPDKPSVESRTDSERLDWLDDDTNLYTIHKRWCRNEGPFDIRGAVDAEIAATTCKRCKSTEAVLDNDGRCIDVSACLARAGITSNDSPRFDLVRLFEALSSAERSELDRAATLGKPETVEAAPLDTWDEAIGPVLWWSFPIKEPPYVGTPLDDDFPDYVTHWSRFAVPTEGSSKPLLPTLLERAGHLDGLKVVSREDRVGEYFQIAGPYRSTSEEAKEDLRSLLRAFRTETAKNEGEKR